MPIEKWLAQQESVRHKYYRSVGEPEHFSILAGGGRKLVGVRRQLRKRRRFFWMPGIAKRFTTFALHDEQRDRLMLIQSDRQETARDLAETIGWAAAAKPSDREPDTDDRDEDDE
jgi:hypothetical protein